MVNSAITKVLNKIEANKAESIKQGYSIQFQRWIVLPVRITKKMNYARAVLEIEAERKGKKIEGQIYDIFKDMTDKEYINYLIMAN